MVTLKLTLKGSDFCPWNFGSFLLNLFLSGHELDTAVGWPGLEGTPGEQTTE